ncbi:cAMP-binding domain of CRP or a regulatory subunit of cAMP-dependent protein kinases [Chitinophaga eiseniae]|uniref:cAMP-binding domain of CRP or a regulatory subunit of cAMP-dependent protein kinases n=1 Tax=Chitinophaga eiseniae TaxID=634771 RepID=A0A1T4U510_9BACT|nr:Crp/Fnr family transcriptional regulator [Chitinophaga eiseniae]SKA47690.1 cAMP-binding domain of CRP or a regulatory subunit of cAMP-dependent protein kinases [Chitinophaga eiseniae]
MQSLHAFFAQHHPLQATTLQQVAALFSPATLPKNHFFVRDGDIARNMAFLESGIVRGFYRKDNGEEFNKVLFSAPSFIGDYASLISGRPAQVSQQALTDAHIWVADYRQVTLLYETCPDLERFARKWAESIFVQKEQREIELTSLDAASRYHNFRKAFPDVEQQISQYHIASWLGISPSHLSRIRRKIAGA